MTNDRKYLVTRKKRETEKYLSEHPDIMDNKLIHIRTICLIVLKKLFRAIIFTFDLHIEEHFCFNFVQRLFFV
jgi:pentose-5-phosphate-3-epimerase